jgi:enoyl-CoA hydratase/carnithine racemase
MYEEILYEISGPVATICFNRPERLNAFTYIMMDELRHALAQAEKEKQVIGIVLTGAGRGFSAGMDMNALDEQANAAEVANKKDKRVHLNAEPGDPNMGEDFRIAFTYLMSIRKPLIAAINGPCAGLGLSIAMLCDMRFAAGNAIFTTAFSQRGLVAEHGQSWILPRVVGPSRALDLLWSSRRFDGIEAERLGLVDRVLPREEVVPKAQAYLEELAETTAPLSLMVMKQQIYRHLNMSLKDAMYESHRLMAESLARPDFKEGVESFIQKRAPRFTAVMVD